MILASNIKRTSSQLFECGKSNFGPLERGHLHRLVFITALLLDHMELRITNWDTEPVQMPREFELQPINLSVTL